MNRTPCSVDVACLPLFANASAGELRIARRLCVTRLFGRGEVLCRIDAVGDEFFVIFDGRVRVDRRGAEEVYLNAGEWFGELAALAPTPRGLRTATVTAVTDGSALVFSGAALREVVDRCPTVTRRLLAHVTKLAIVMASESATPLVATPRSGG